MNKEKIADLGKRILASLAIFTMLSSYSPILCTIAMAVSEEIESTANNIEEKADVAEETTEKVVENKEIDNIKEEKKDQNENTEINDNLNQNKTNTINSNNIISNEEKQEVSNNSNSDITKNVIVKENNDDIIVKNSEEGSNENLTDTEEIKFKDENFKAYLLKEYDIDKDGKITSYDMLQITNLYIYSYNNNLITDLTGIEYAKNLEQLSLSVSNSVDISAINGLPVLKIVRLYYHNEDISVLKTLPSLEELSISMDFQAQDDEFNSINELVNLKNLDISFYGAYQSKVFDINNIKNLRNLEELRIYNSEVSNIEILNDFPKLRDLRIKLNDSIIDTVEQLKIENLEYEYNCELNDIMVEKGKTKNIDIPNIIKKVSASNNKLYMGDFSTYYTDLNGNSNNLAISLNKDNTKIDINATNLEVGKYEQEIHIYSYYNKSVTIRVNFSVYQSVDKKEEIDIKDEEFKKYLLKNHDIDQDKKITNYDMLQISKMNIDYNYNKIADIREIEYAKNMQELSIYSGNITDISVIHDLPLLKIVRLEYVNIKDISVLKTLPKLEEVHISEYSSSTSIDYSVLNDVKNLKNLNISTSNREINVSQINKLTGLEILHIYAPISNVEKIGKFKNLKELTLQTKTTLEDISFVSKLTELKRLYLEDNMINDITPLRDLKNLEYVSLLKNPINTKEQETATTLKLLKDKNVQVNIVDTNATENIEFKDEKFKNALLSYGADLNKDNQISIDEMEKLYSLSLSGEKITCVDEIEYATNLNSLYIYVDIEDMTPILKLKNIGYLSIYSNLIKNLSELNNMKGLRRLSISNNYRESKIFDLTGIADFKELTYLSLSAEVTKIDEIKKLPKLTELSINDKIYNAKGNLMSHEEILEFINSMKNLKKVHLSGSSIEVDLGNILLNSDKKVNIKDLDCYLKALYTPESVLYSEEIKIEDYSNRFNIKDNELTIDTSKLVKNMTGYLYISSENFYANIRIKWSTYVQGDTTKEIDIPDNNLKKVLLENYDIDQDKRITENDLINIIGLDIYNCNISSLEGMQYATNMNYIYADYNEISDLTPIVNLKSLQDISLNNNLITDITVLDKAEWKKLYYIELKGNFINFEKGSQNYEVLKKIIYNMSDDAYVTKEGVLERNINNQAYGNISEINTIVELEENLKNALISNGIDVNKDKKISRKELYFADANLRYGIMDLSGADISDISGLEYMNVWDVNLSNNNISDITPITKNNQIYTMDLSDNNISDISGIENMYSLRNLDIQNNKITNIEPLTKLDIMQKDSGKETYRDVTINLSNNQISNIKCVKDWKNLYSLDLTNNKITDISELKNYNFCLSKEYTEEQNNMNAKQLKINLSENNIDMKKSGNKKAKEVFDKKGAKLIIVDKSRTKLYTINEQGCYSEDSNLGIVDTDLSPEIEYEFVPEVDRTLYPENSDANLAGIFINTRYYDAEHNIKLKEKGYDLEFIVTGAIKTQKPAEYGPYIILKLKVPDGYIGNDAKVSNDDSNIMSTTKDTIYLRIKLNADENNNCYYTIKESICVKAKAQVISDVKDKTEIIEAIQKEQDVTLDMKEDVSDVSNEIFDTLSQKKDVELKVETTNATWKFSSDNITNTEIALNPTVTISDTRFENMSAGPIEDGIFLKFDHEGELPGKAEIELDVKSINKYEKGKTIYLYYFDSTKNKYQYINTLTSDLEKITIVLEHCSEYVITDKMLNVLGDINADDKINARDAKMALQYFTGKIELNDSQKQAADVNGDGKINARDAKLILQYFTGKISEF